MSDSHGRHSFYGKNRLCTNESFHVERIGRFGRMFRDLPPLYTNPSSLANLGRKGGPMDSGNEISLTSSVPLGMIFLGQFIDHDITFDTASSFNNIISPDEIENDRTAKLDLDCVFGNGPEDEPFMYVDGGRLLTGETNNNIGQEPTIEKHDLARNGLGRAIIGDPRNDENRVISQLQLAFIRFYNSIFEEVVDRQEEANRPISSRTAYEEARQTATWHYQWVVVNEFLPLICGSYVVNDILGNGRQYYQPKSEAFIPVEFSVAAYRFGHSMIAQNMKLKSSGEVNNIFSDAFGRGFSKIENLDQVVEWDAFFDFDNRYQRAEKIDIALASDLLELPGAIVGSSEASLATRNLKRGQSFLLPSGEQVARRMGRDDYEITQIFEFVDQQTSDQGIDLQSGIPLWLYILAEAQVIGRQDKKESIPGEGLGPVGGRIVAEVILGLLELDATSYLGSNRDWRPTLGDNYEFRMRHLLERASRYA